MLVFVLVLAIVGGLFAWLGVGGADHAAGHGTRIRADPRAEFTTSQHIEEPGTVNKEVTSLVRHLRSIKIRRWGVVL
ncbi:hypothetical protein XA68_18048 [Ophiocordyceps unilateralis]|uniref:Secreted protein n=1 Tax=Ophiocordyceps unilateralis TaxID=268505 RepID=A0A2A9PI37_OPHUN|nr:hypothetical protein XA68_18048 [Ophiocordyceps unilateralis]